MARSMYAVVNQKLPWNFAVELTKKACDELAFLDENVDPLIFIPPGHFWNRLLNLSILTHPITPVVLSSIMTKSKLDSGRKF